MPPLRDMEADQPLRAGDCGDFRAVPNDLDVMLPGAFYRPGVHALPEDIGAGLGNHSYRGDMLAIAADRC